QRKRNDQEMVLSIPKEVDPFEVLQQIQNDSMVETAGFPALMWALAFPESGPPSDTWYPSQANLEAIGLPDVWEHFTTGDSTIIVAVIDSGAEWDHEDLHGNRWLSNTNPYGGRNYFPDLGVDPTPIDS